MFTLNKYGKLSLLSAVPAFVCSLFASYSTAQYYGYNFMFSSLINAVVEPILRLVSSPPQSEGVAMKPPGLLPVIEEQAIVLFYGIAMVLCVVTIIYTLKAAKKNEFTIWYANSMFCCGAAIYLLNPFVALAAVAVTIVLVLKFRGRNEVVET